jgi:hypothetical protein
MWSGPGERGYFLNKLSKKNYQPLILKFISTVFELMCFLSNREIIIGVVSSGGDGTDTQRVSLNNKKAYTYILKLE